MFVGHLKVRLTLGMKLSTFHNYYVLNLSQKRYMGVLVVNLCMKSEEFKI